MVSSPVAWTGASVTAWTGGQSANYYRAYVDDSRVVSDDLVLLDRFAASFNRRFPNSLAPGLLSASVDQDFAGVKYERSGKGSSAKIELSCARLLADLKKTLADLPPALRASIKAPPETPMDENALRDTVPEAW